MEAKYTDCFELASKNNQLPVVEDYMSEEIDKENRISYVENQDPNYSGKFKDKESIQNICLLAMNLQAVI